MVQGEYFITSLLYPSVQYLLDCGSRPLQKTPLSRKLQGNIYCLSIHANMNQCATLHNHNGNHSTRIELFNQIDELLGGKLRLADEKMLSRVTSTMTSDGKRSSAMLAILVLYEVCKCNLVKILYVTVTVT